MWSTLHEIDGKKKILVSEGYKKPKQQANKKGISMYRQENKF